MKQYSHSAGLVYNNLIYHTWSLVCFSVECNTMNIWADIWTSLYPSGIIILRVDII